MRRHVSGSSKYFAGAILALFAVGSLWVATPQAAAKPWKKKEKVSNRMPFQPSGEWEAFFKDENGREFRLLEPVEQNEDSDWMTLEFTEYKGNRSRIAIWKVDNKVETQTAVQTYGYGPFQMKTERSLAPLEAIEELLTTAIFNTNRFSVVERKKMAALMAEQDLGTSGVVTEASAAKIGRALGADYILFASLNEWTPKRRARKRLGLGKSMAEVAMSIRVVDTESSEVVDSVTLRGTADNRSMNLPFIGSRQDVAPVNYALTACINKAAYRLAKNLKVRPWRGAVVDVTGGMVVLNGGENRGVAEGQLFRAIRKGKELIDPESGKSLGFNQEVIGTLKVTTVKENISTSVVMEGCEGLKAGDFVTPVEERGEEGP